jgi:hypothetical protein
MARLKSPTRQLYDKYHLPKQLWVHCRWGVMELLQTGGFKPIFFFSDTGQTAMSPSQASVHLSSEVEGEEHASNVVSINLPINNHSPRACILGFQ